MRNIRLREIIENQKSRVYYFKIDVLGLKIEFTLLLEDDNVTSQHTKSNAGLKESIRCETKKTIVLGEPVLRRHISIDIWQDRVSLWEKIKNKLKKK